jgi:hypothetical protein
VLTRRYETNLPKRLVRGAAPRRRRCGWTACRLRARLTQEPLYQAPWRPGVPPLPPFQNVLPAGGTPFGPAPAPVSSPTPPVQPLGVGASARQDNSPTSARRDPYDALPRRQARAAPRLIEDHLARWAGICRRHTSRVQHPHGPAMRAAPLRSQRSRLDAGRPPPRPGSGKELLRPGRRSPRRGFVEASA